MTYRPFLLALPRTILLIFCGIALIIFLCFFHPQQQYSFRLSLPHRFVDWKILSTDDNATLGVMKKIYVIHLPNRTDRRDEMEQLRRALGLRWTYVEAMPADHRLVGKIMACVSAIRTTMSTNARDTSFVWPEEDPSPGERISPWDPRFLAMMSKIPAWRNFDIPLLKASENYTPAACDHNTPDWLFPMQSEIACWYSHVSVIERIANDASLRDNDAALILEDDVDMERDIHARLKHVWAYLPEEWDIVFLGHCCSEENFYPALDFTGNSTTTTDKMMHLHPSRSPWCGHAYALTRAGARRLLVHLRHMPLAYSRPIDAAMSMLVEKQRVKSFSIVPSIISQRKCLISDIADGTRSEERIDLIHGVLSGSA